MRCPACGAEMSNPGKFCEMCGSPLSSRAETVDQLGQTQTYETQPVNPQPTDVMQMDQTQQFSQNEYETVQQTYQQPYQQDYQQSYQQGYQAEQQYDPYADQQGYQQTTAYGAPVQPTAQMPYGSAPQKQATSTPFVLSIIALVTAILGLFPVSLVLAIIALVMNSGQKKRGEVSTKQTPTFVMSIISLVLSVLMAIFTIIIGSAVWTAAMNGYFNNSSNSSSSFITITTSSDGAVGTWEAVSATIDGEALDEDYLTALRDMGMTTQLTMTSDGKATLIIFGISEEGTWKDKGAGKISLTFEGDAIDGTVEGDTLTLLEPDNNIVFERVTASEAAPSNSSSAAASSSSNAASSSTSAASASSAAASDSSSDSYSTTERPALSDFTWFTADMIEGKLPSGATTLTKFAEVKGGWKAYLFGSGMERFLNADIAGSKDSATVTLDWFYAYDGAKGEGHDDNTPNSTFSGTWQDGLLDARSNSGRLTLADFWLKDNHEYAVGSFVWPDGQVDNILLVRP